MVPRSTVTLMRWAIAALKDGRSSFLPELCPNADAMNGAELRIGPRDILQRDLPS